MTHEERSAGHLIVETLAAHGVERVFAVPGESFLDVLDGLYDSPIQTVVCRQEGGVGFMALAEGRLTGRPGIAMVTRGPGAANFFIAAHCAYQDATPLVCFVGLVPIADRRRESFQEFSLDNWFGSTAKRVLTVEVASMAGEIVAEAMHVATSGRPGPVIVGLPEDILREMTTVETPQPRATSAPSPSPDQLAELRDRLLRAERPVLVAGGEGFTGATGTRLADWALASGIPVFTDWRNYDVIPSDHAAYCGWLGYGRRQQAADALAEADLVITVGGVRSDVMSDGYTIGMAAETVVITPDANLLQHAGRVDQCILATPDTITRALTDLGPVAVPSRTERCTALRAGEVRFASESAPGQPIATSFLDQLFRELNRLLPERRILTYGAGNATIWGHRFIQQHGPQTLVASRNGAMGMAVPAAVSAALSHPEHTVVAVCGDGDFFMNAQEIATLLANEGSALFVVVDNGCYATIVDHQRRWYPGRPSGTTLANPDLVTWIESFGGSGLRLEPGDDPIKVRDLIEKDGIRLLHLVVDGDTSAPDGSGF